MTISFKEFQEAHSNYSTTKAYKESTWEEIIREFRKPMVPSLLSNKDIVESYKRFKEERIKESNRKAAWALDQVKVRLSNGMSIAEIIEDRELETYSILMYLIAATDKNEEAMDRYRKDAIYDMRIMPEKIPIYSRLFDRRIFPNDK